GRSFQPTVGRGQRVELLIKFGYAREANLINHVETNQKQFHQLSMYPIFTEWQRALAFYGQVLKFPQRTISVYEFSNSVQFSTRQGSKTGKDGPQSNDQWTTTTSPGIDTTPRSSRPIEKFDQLPRAPLQHNQMVTVWDISSIFQNEHGDINESDVNEDFFLSVFRRRKLIGKEVRNEEIPPNSLVGIVHTANKYKEDKISFNIQAVYILVKPM
ncbi:hypothetical protein FA95DRAFT_1578418, partial [Auriscalpium vulgare]